MIEVLATTARAFLACLVLAVGIALPGAAFAQDIFGLDAGSGTSQDSTAEASPLQTLIEVLKDDAARRTLIEELEAQAAADTTGQTGAAADTGDTPATEAATFGGQVAEYTQRTTLSVSQALVETWRQISQLPAIFASLGDADYRVLGALLLDLAVLVIVTYGVFLAVRLLTEAFRKRLDLHAARSGWLMMLVAGAVLLVSNLVIVAAAWAAGQATAVALSSAGRAAFVYFLFLNVFVVVEAGQALVRAVLAPRRPDLRFVPLSDDDAWMLTRWFRWTVSVIAYGQLLVVPLFSRFVSVGSSRAVSVIVYIVALAMAVNLVLRLQEPVRDWLRARANDNPASPLRAFAGVWHLPVLAYLLVLSATVLVWPGAALAGLLGATAKVLLAVALGAIAAGLLHRIILRGIKLPERVATRIPLLEQRLNAFVPRALTALRILVFVVVAAFTLDAIGLFNLDEWLASEFGSRVASTTVTVAVMLLVAFAAWLALTSFVDYRLQPANGTMKSRERTLLVLARNAATITIIVFALMFVLSEIGINIAPLLASAGVIGLAIGFGAQKLVQDIITGIFIQLEGAIDVGDVVNIGGISGVVERMTVRSAGLRDLNGVYHVVPFSSVDTVSNFMRGFAFALCDMGVAYRENLEDVKQAMFDAYEELKKNEEVAADLVEPTLEWMGIDKFADSAVIVRARIKTLPGRQWSVNRAYNAEIKKIFDARNIEIPFPHQTIYFGEDKAGNAPPLHVAEAGRRTPRPKPAAQPAAEEPKAPARKPRRSRKPRPPEIPDTDDFTPPDDSR